jgi:hypothetical protein
MTELQITMPDYYKNKRTIPRFPEDVPDDSCRDQVIQYYRNHSIRGLHLCATWTGIVELLPGGWGVKTTFEHEKKTYTSVYVYAKFRGQGHMSKFLKENQGVKIATAPSCQIENFLKSHGADYLLIKPCDFPEYAMVEKYYGDSVTDRTGIHMINHIDEGLFILEKIGASELAKRAYILHPLVQADADLKAFWSSNGPDIVDRKVLALALEYRNIANAHLSFHAPGEDSFNLSPLKDVNDMLIADKVQNRKDFELYHEGSHNRGERLKTYFQEWLRKLRVSEAEYENLKAEMIHRTGGMEIAMKSKNPSAKEKQTDDSEQPGFNQIPKALRGQSTSSNLNNSQRKSDWLHGFGLFSLGLTIGIVVSSMKNRKP